MIDEATIERWMREANPIPTLDDVDTDEFARFVATAHTRRAAVMQAPTRHPTPTTTPVTPPPPRRRKAWAFAAAFILIIAAIGIAALTTRGGGESPIADEPMAPVTVTTPPSTTSTPDPIDVQSLTWTRVPHDAAVFNPTGDDMMWDVTVGGPGLVAVGNMGSDAGVWVSEDGIAWSLVTSTEPTTTDPMDVDPLRTEGEMHGVAVGGPGLVAVGSAWTVEGPILGAAVWTSEDGISWSKAIVESESEGMYDITAGGPGLVAIGVVLVEDWSVEEEGPVPFAGAIWTSIDGITWTQTKVLGAGEQIYAVAATENGLIAVGEAELWTSADGMTWTGVPRDGTVSGQWNDVVAGGPGLVAVGGGGFSAAAWTSPDGLTWTQVPPSQFTGSELPLQSVISVGTQLVAVGGADVWTSVDGITWTQTTMKISGAEEIHAVAATEDGLIAVGQDGGSAAVWIATED